MTYKDALMAFQAPQPRELLAARKLTDRDLAKVKGQLPTREIDIQETKLVKGIAETLNIGEEGICRLLAIKPATALSLSEAVKRGVALSSDLEDRIKILLEIIATAAALTGKPSDDPAVRQYLANEGHLDRLKKGSFASLLETRHLLYNLAGGVWGRKDAQASTD